MTGRTNSENPDVGGLTGIASSGDHSYNRSIVPGYSFATNTTL